MAEELVNPYQVTADTLIQVLANWPPLLSLLGMNEAPPEIVLKIVQSGDQPSLRIRPYRGGGAQFKATSNSNLFIQAFEIGLWVQNEQDDGSIPPDFWSLKWETMRAFNAALEIDPTMGLKAKGVNATVIKFLDISEDDQNQDYNRGSFGWTSLIVVSVAFTVKSISMR